MNRYADDILKPGLCGRVRQVTLMSPESFERLIAFISAGDITWSDLVTYRFSDDKVVASSVSQAIYDWRVEAKLDVRRHGFILKDLDSIFQILLAKYEEDPSENTSAVRVAFGRDGLFLYSSQSTVRSSGIRSTRASSCFPGRPQLTCYVTEGSFRTCSVQRAGWHRGVVEIVRGEVPRAPLRGRALKRIGKLVDIGGPFVDHGVS